MKRSEMISRIVYGALSWDGLDTSGVPAEEIANDILKIIERAGMLPPEIKNPLIPENIGPHDHAYLRFRSSSLPEKFYINGWEDED